MALNDDDAVYDRDEDAPIHDQVSSVLAIIEKGDFDAIYDAIIFMLDSSYVKFWKAGSFDNKMAINKVLNAKETFKVDNVGRGKSARRRRVAALKFNRVGAVNNWGEAFSAMEQSDLAKIFWEAWLKTGDDIYKQLCHNALDVLVDDYKTEGGLNLSGFFVGQTSRSQKDIGRTLNKSLVAVLNMFNIGQAMGNSQYQNLAVASMRKLAGKAAMSPQGAPSIYDYVPDHNSNRSWLYYGIGGGGGYFLNTSVYKNAGYHIFVLALIYTIADRMGSRFPLEEWSDTAKLGKSPLWWIYRSLEIKEAEGLYVDSPNPSNPGNFKAAMVGRHNKIYTGYRNWYKQFMP